MDISEFLATYIRKKPKITRFVKKLAQKISPETVAILDYPLKFRQRWELDSPHPLIYTILNHNRDKYKETLRSFLALSNWFLKIPSHLAPGVSPHNPYWVNGWMPALDGVALYGFIATRKPKVYMEVGSGTSTMFARKAIVDHDTGTKIVSIDPWPRADINEICDEIVRKPVEDVDLHIFNRLGPGDILYIDNSHRIFMNSDVTTIFIDVIPRLKPGVLVHIHDIMLPYDYPVEWCHRYYSEQYLLAAYLLAGGNSFETILPNTFISHDQELRSVLGPLWQHEELRGVETHGCSFWLEMN